jgi:hypothetical protein
MQSMQTAGIGENMLIIDRFEGDYAVVETNLGMVNIPRTDLPPEAVEGSVLSLSLDLNETQTRKERIEKLANSLFT